MTASHIEGPLHAEVMGPEDGPPMVFVHPIPMDHTAWIYQMAHFSTWYRCIAIDVPGFGRSPRATPGLTMADIAEACWDAVARVTARSGAVLVGCSVGSHAVQWMYHARPGGTDAVVVSGAGWRPVNTFARERIQDYRERGIGFRYAHALAGLSAQFRQTALADWLATLVVERNDSADLDTIIRVFEAVSAPAPDWLHARLVAPVLIITGSECSAHEASFALRDRLPDAELVTLDGAGHACQFERPREFDREMMRFLYAHGHDWLEGALTDQRS